MAYGQLRFLYDNLITSVSMLTLSSQANGRTSGSKKTGSGSAIIDITGPFQGAFDLSYTIEIDSIGAGTEVGQATFRWRTSDTTAGAWEQTGVTTATTPVIALSADGLGTNIKVSWTGALGNDFALGDTWQFECRANYGGERLLDRNRNTYWKTTGITSENIVIDYGAATKVTASVLHDHNFTSSAVVKFQANATDSWGSPSVDYTFTTITEALVYYHDSTYRYNRWLIADTTNTDSFLRVANIMSTEYLALSKVNADWGSSQTPGMRIQGNESEPGVLRRYWYSDRNDLVMDFGRTLKNNDVNTLISMSESLRDTVTRQIIPLWVHQFYDQPETLMLMDWFNIDQWQRRYSSYLLNSDTSLVFHEAVKV
jgi:hypothetical protein